MKSLVQSINESLNVKPSDNLQKKYHKLFPNDSEYTKIRPDVTIADVWEFMQTPFGKRATAYPELKPVPHYKPSEQYSFYNFVSVDMAEGIDIDSLTRENIFDMIANAYKIDYDKVYDEWLKDA